MNTLWKLLKADFLKMKHTMFYWTHLLIPLLGIGIFLSYYSYSTWDTVSEVIGYIQSLAVAFPLLIGILCAFAVEQEALAGNFKELLGAEYGKHMALMSKIVMLLTGALGSTLLAVIGFAAGSWLLLKKQDVPFFLYFKIGLIIFLCQIFIYLVHLWISFQFGKGASIGAGIMESLIAALMLTGMGHGIWQWIPCAWSGRLSTYFLTESLKTEHFSLLLSDERMGVISCIGMTGAMFIAFMTWFYFYEGHKEI